MSKARPKSALPAVVVPSTASEAGLITREELCFAQAYVRLGGNVEAAAREAMPGSSNPLALGKRWLKRGHVCFAVKQEQAKAALLCGSVALATLIDVAQDLGQSGTARVAAAKALAQVAGLMTPEGRQGRSVEDHMGPNTITSMEQELALVQQRISMQRGDELEKDGG